MKTSKTTELMVGMFIAAGAAGLFVLAMQVSNLSGFAPADSYTITAQIRKYRRAEGAFTGDGGWRTGWPGGIDIDYDNDRFEAVVAAGNG